jgi:hypothetical protein
VEALDQINKEYGMKSQASVSAYLGNLRSINAITNENMDLMSKANEIEEKKANVSYDGYLANNGASLMNSNIDSINQNVLS